MAKGLVPVATERFTTYLLWCHAALAALAVGWAIVAQHPEVIAVGAPSLCALGFGLTSARFVDLEVGADFESSRAVEGDVIGLDVTLAGPRRRALVDVELGLGFRFDAGTPTRSLVTVDRNQTRRVRFEVRAKEWGVAAPESLVVRSRDRWGLVVNLQEFVFADAELRVHLPDERLGSLLTPNRFRPVVGTHDSPDRGDGCEIADVRAYQPGDRLRSINWRISARRDEPWVTLRHPDRSSTVVIVLDAYAAVGAGDESSIRRSVRAAMALARGHLDAQDKVGLLVAGAVDLWIEPRLGRRQLHRITDSLLESARVLDDAPVDPSLDVERVVPNDCLIVAISPLIDRRMFELLRRLRARGQGVTVIEPLVAPATYTRRELRRLPMLDVSRRWFELEQQARRSSLRDHGIRVVAWHYSQPLAVPMRQAARLQAARTVGANR